MPGVSDVHGILLRSESAASSEIENLTVGAKQLAIAELGGAARRNANLVSRNVRAMKAAIRLAEHLDTDSILAMQGSCSPPTRRRPVNYTPCRSGSALPGSVPPAQPSSRPTPTAYPRAWTSSRSARAAGPEPAGSR